MRRATASLVFVGVAALTLVFLTGGRASAYGILVFCLLGVKLYASARTQHWQPDGARLADLDHYRVVVVIPIFNEDPGLFAQTLASLDAQSRAPDAVWIVDDGSDATDCYEMACRWAATRPWVHVHRQPNAGKRVAQAVGFRAEESADIFVTVDSDTVLEPDAIEQGLKPFCDPRVTAVTGVVLASNYRKNLLTRLIDVRYTNAFLYERAAYSAVGSVLCMCGSLAFYRAEIVRRHLHDFTHQQFLGRRVSFGDDRRLTNYALLHGRALLQPAARAHTAVPERLGHFVRQQLRWNKSFFRESLWAVQHLPLHRPASWLALFELTSWVVFTAVLLYAVAIRPLTVGPIVLGGYAGFVVFMSYARSVRFLGDDKAFGRQGAWVSFLLAPLYGLLHVVLLVPLRLWSLVTLRSSGWGTRTRVEVRAA